LGLQLQDLGVKVDVVAGLPRGGVVVAAEVAEVLQRPLEILVVRKIGHPWHREFAVGALAENDVVILDEGPLTYALPPGDELDEVIVEEHERLEEYCHKFCPDHIASFSGKRVLVVDDGLATGATAEAAVRCAFAKKAEQVIVAVPVASANGYERLAWIADRVITLLTDPYLSAVGEYYKQFNQTTDEEVSELLHRPHGTRQDSKNPLKPSTTIRWAG